MLMKKRYHGYTGIAQNPRLHITPTRGIQFHVRYNIHKFAGMLLHSVPSESTLSTVCSDRNHNYTKEKVYFPFFES